MHEHLKNLLCQSQCHNVRFFLPSHPLQPLDYVLHHSTTPSLLMIHFWQHCNLMTMSKLSKMSKMSKMTKISKRPKRPQICKTLDYVRHPFTTPSLILTHFWHPCTSWQCQHVKNVKNAKMPYCDKFSKKLKMVKCQRYGKISIMVKDH